MWNDSMTGMKTDNTQQNQVKAGTQEAQTLPLPQVKQSEWVILSLGFSTISWVNERKNKTQDLTKVQSNLGN